MSHNEMPAGVYQISQRKLSFIPRSPWVYWINDNIRNLFKDLPGLENILNAGVGQNTGDNFRFLRYWWEVGLNRIGFFFSKLEDTINSPYRWYPYMKGGSLVRWYGNQRFVINWENDAEEMKEYAIIRNKGKHWSRYLQNLSLCFKEGITWSDISSKGFGVRYLPPGFIFDVQGSSGFTEKDLLYSILAVMNSIWMEYALDLLNATLHHQIGDIRRIPFPKMTKDQEKIFDKIVIKCIHIQQTKAMNSEKTYDFISPPIWIDGGKNEITLNKQLSMLEKITNEKVYDLYGITKIDQLSIEAELAGELVGKDDLADRNLEEEDEDSIELLDHEDLAFNWISYTVGIAFKRFQLGVPGVLGSAIYHKSEFAIGSLPEPSKEEFNDLVGEPSDFAYIDEDGGRHVFSKEVEQALQDLALPDGIAVFDENHPRDLPTLVRKALVLMLGEEQTQEVIRVAADGDLRQFLQKDFFTQHHIKQYRKRPVYWPIQSAKHSYGFVLFHEKIDRNTFYALQQPPYLPTKQRAVQLLLEDLSKQLLTMQGSERKSIEKEIGELRQLADELTQFAKDLEEITKGGYEPEENWIDDGVILRMAPLWKVIPLLSREPKKYWDRLKKGEYDWSHTAMHYWPERVKKTCQNNKSYAIAHEHEEWYIGN